MLVVDGMSDDGTRAVIEEYAQRHPHVHLLDNPKQITPSALNIGIAAARGAIVMRMDAHVEYPPDYISKLVDRLAAERRRQRRRRLPDVSGQRDFAGRAIAVGMSHPLGVGNSYFRIGVFRAALG